MRPLIAARFRQQLLDPPIKLRADLIGAAAISLDRPPDRISNIAPRHAKQLHPRRGLGPFRHDGMPVRTGHRDQQIGIPHEHVGRHTQTVGKNRPYILAQGWTPGGLTDSAGLRERIAPPVRQLSLF